MASRTKQRRRPRRDGPAPRATERAYAVLKREFLEALIRPGERILDAEVARRLEVSRTPVPEALLALEREGLVRIVPRQGYFASEISVSDALDAYQLRALLEPPATALAARRIDAVAVLLREIPPCAAATSSSSRRTDCRSSSSTSR